MDWLNLIAADPDHRKMNGTSLASICLSLSVFPPSPLLIFPHQHYLISLSLLSVSVLPIPVSRPSWLVSSASFPRKWSTLQGRSWMQLLKFTTAWALICCPLQPNRTTSSISVTSPSVSRVRHSYSLTQACGLSLSPWTAQTKLWLCWETSTETESLWILEPP